MSIIQGDCLQILPTMPEKSVDIIMTSPPYNVGLKYPTYDDKRVDFYEWLELCLGQFHRVMSDNSRMYLIIHEDMIYKLRPLAEANNFKYHQLLVWNKSNMASPSRISKDWNCMAEWCQLYHKGKRTTMINEIQGVKTFNWITESTPQSNFKNNHKRQFIAQMSVKVCYAWLARTPGKTVLDPFCGSGTTLIAAKQLNKDYIGIDIDPVTIDLAKKRLSNCAYYQQEQISLL